MLKGFSIKASRSKWAGHLPRTEDKMDQETNKMAAKDRKEQERTTEEVVE